jgi:hypothetical protein
VISPILQRGNGLVIRRAEQHEVAVARLATALAVALLARSIYNCLLPLLLPHRFGRHYDFENIFIAHTAGVKEYFLCANTIDRQRERSTPHHAVPPAEDTPERPR